MPDPNRGRLAIQKLKKQLHLGSPTAASNIAATYRELGNPRHPVQVAAGETVQLELRVASQPLILPPVTVTVTADVCVPAKNLTEHPELHTLWQQARGRPG